MTLIIGIIYGLGWVIFGYFCAREVYNFGGRDIPKHSGGWALISWIGFGWLWPIFLLWWLWQFITAPNWIRRGCEHFARFIFQTKAA